MDAKTRAMMNETEQALLRQISKTKLAKLDEDALIDLHTQVRRARSKYVKLLRRRGAAQVRHDRSRTRAAGSVSKTAVKAEAFEEALGLVSAQLAKVASAAAEALKQERLAAAGKGKGTAPASRTAGKGKTTASKAPRSRARTPIDKKRVASARGQQKRSQARRDTKR